MIFRLVCPAVPPREAICPLILLITIDVSSLKVNAQYIFGTGINVSSATNRIVRASARCSNGLTFDAYVGNRKRARPGFPDLPHKTLIPDLDKRNSQQPGKRAGVDLAMVYRHSCSHGPETAGSVARDCGYISALSWRLWHLSYEEFHKAQNVEGIDVNNMSLPHMRATTLSLSVMSLAHEVLKWSNDESQATTP